MVEPVSFGGRFRAWIETPPWSNAVRGEELEPRDEKE